MAVNMNLSRAPVVSDLVRRARCHCWMFVIKVLLERWQATEVGPAQVYAAGNSWRSSLVQYKTKSIHRF